MLTHIEVTNYKSISQTSLSLGKETIIVGQNGVGKSNLLDAIHFVRDALRDGLDQSITKRHGILSIRRWSKTRPYNVGIKLSFQKGEERGEYRIAISSAGGEVSGIEEEAEWYGREPFPGEKEKPLVTFRFKRNAKGEIKLDLPESPFFPTVRVSVPEYELLLSQASASFYSPIGVYFKSLYNQIVSCGAYSIYPNRIREPQAISNQEVLADDGSNLASIIRQMRSTTFRGQKEQLAVALRQVLPILEQINIVQAGGFYVPVFQVRESNEGHAHNLNMSQISDGTLRMLGMLTSFYQPRAPDRITLEEPEQMVHPGLLSVLVESGRDYLDVRSDRQVLYTTHSPVFLDLFRPDSIIGASFEDGVTVFSHMSHRQRKIVDERLFTAGALLLAEGIA